MVVNTRYNPQDVEYQRKRIDRQTIFNKYKTPVELHKAISNQFDAILAQKYSEEVLDRRERVIDALLRFVKLVSTSTTISLDADKITTIIKLFYRENQTLKKTTTYSTI